MSSPKQTSSKSAAKMIIDLENKFWRSMVDHDTDTAIEMLSEPSLMVSTMGAMKFGHDDYRKMADHGSMEVTAFELSNIDVVFPNDTTAILSYHVKQAVKERGKSESLTQEMNDTSTWIQSDGQWRCVMHTETPMDAQKMKH
jgi:hypothetical protein